MSKQFPLNGVAVVIMAGGQGTRFWPISRLRRPKQFLSISSNGESLIAATARRIAPLVEDGQITVVTNVLHEPLIREHVPKAKLICEPVGRNTAASIGFAAIKLLKESPGKDPIMVVLPADHAVKNEQMLRDSLADAVELARVRDLLVTVGVKPTNPNTAYGYIKQGAHLHGRAYQVSRFFEKPSVERAIKYLEAGDFLWNTGMFVWRASVIGKAIREEMPALGAALARIEEALGTSRENEVVSEVFADLENISIDFGVLEHVKNCAVVAADSFGWNDVGSWDAWAEHFEDDENGNMRYGQTVMIDSKNCVINSADRMIALLGMEDVVVIDSGDAVLVCPRSRVQDVRKIVECLQREGRTQFI